MQILLGSVGRPLVYIILGPAPFFPRGQYMKWIYSIGLNEDITAHNFNPHINYGPPFPFLGLNQLKLST